MLIQSLKVSTVNVPSHEVSQDAGRERQDIKSRNQVLFMFSGFWSYGNSTSYLTPTNQPASKMESIYSLAQQN